MRTDELQRIILRMLRGKELYGYEIHKRLGAEGLEIEISRLYRVLNDMLRQGYLDGRWESSRLGPDKRMYMVGKRGWEALDTILLEAIQTVHDRYAEYLLNLPPEKNVISNISKMLTDELKEQGFIAFISTEYSSMHERVLSTLHNNAPYTKIYFVKPALVEVDLKLDNLSLLDGDWCNIPLKEHYVDLVIGTNAPERGTIDPALRESCRVLKQSGGLGILIPTVLVHAEDPLTIGGFIEKYEHEKIEGSEAIDVGFIEASLRRFFSRVEERQIVHMTLFLASNPYPYVVH